MRGRREAPETAKCQADPALSGKGTCTPCSAPGTPRELPQARLAHGRLENSGTKEHLAPQKCTAAAPVCTGGPEQIRPDERGRRQCASGPGAGRGPGESDKPRKEPFAPGGPWAREMSRGVSSGGREMRGRYCGADRLSQAALAGAGGAASGRGEAILTEMHGMGLSRGQNGPETRPRAWTWSSSCAT